MFIVHWRPDCSPSFIQMLFNLVYYGLLSEEFAPQTITKICEHTKNQQEDGTILSTLYLLLS